MLVSSYISPPSPSTPFYATAKRYQADEPRESGYTLILLHATGLHKETFEPTIECLFQLSSHKGSSVLREAWTVDCPNHGQGAVMNEAILRHEYSEKWDGYIYPRVLHAFLHSCPGGINLLDHRLVVAGHSLGGNAAVLLTTLSPRVPLSAIILMDAYIGDPSPEWDHMDAIATRMLWSKPDVWRSRRDALNMLSRSPGFRMWDKRVLELYVSYALVTHPASGLPAPHNFDGVTLACKKNYEASCYRAREHHEAALAQLQRLYGQGPPVHLIWSSADEYNNTSGRLKDVQLYHRYGGGPASVQRIKEGTHMFVQQCPEATAKSIGSVLADISGHPAKL